MSVLRGRQVFGPFAWGVKVLPEDPGSGVMLESVSVRSRRAEPGQRRIKDALRDLLEELCAVDAADTVAVLGAAWRSFSAVLTLNTVLAGAALHTHDPAVIVSLSPDAETPCQRGRFDDAT